MSWVVPCGHRQHVTNVFANSWEQGLSRQQSFTLQLDDCGFNSRQCHIVATLDKLLTCHCYMLPICLLKHYSWRVIKN